MIDLTLLKQFSITTLIVCLVGSGVLFAATSSLHIAAGLLAGGIIGMIPFITWAMIIGPLMQRGGFASVAIIMFLKFAFYGVVFYALVWRRTVNVMAFGGGIAFATMMMALSALLKTPPKVEAGGGA